MINYLLIRKLVFILGLINIASFILVFSSCRCIIGLNISQKLLKYKLFQSIYKYHKIFWLIFFISIILHSILAFIGFGIPN